MPAIALEGKSNERKVLNRNTAVLVADQKTVEGIRTPLHRETSTVTATQLDFLSEEASVNESSNPDVLLEVEPRLFPPQVGTVIEVLSSRTVSLQAVKRYTDAATDSVSLPWGSSLTWKDHPVIKTSWTACFPGTAARC